MKAQIYYTEIKKDADGNEWYYINGDTGYLIKYRRGSYADKRNTWSIEEADKDYMSEKSQIERELSFRRANGFYD